MLPNKAPMLEQQNYLFVQTLTLLLISTPNKERKQIYKLALVQNGTL